MPIILNDEVVFEKVPYEEFEKSASGVFFSKDECEDAYEHITLPRRGTSGSAGYDFYSPYSFTIFARKPVTVFTGIRCKMPESCFLMIVPRSGLGFNYGMHLENTVGIIDSDYYKAMNYGHIAVKVSLFDNEKWLEISRGDRFCQGILLPYIITADDKNNPIVKNRVGGFGSTGG